jgi:hypothetical protein
VGWHITETDEAAIETLPEHAWTAAVRQDGQIQPECHIAELTGLNTRLAGWPAGIRLIVRRAHPSKRHLGKLTDLEKRTG